MSRRKDPHYVVFGAGSEPNKVLMVAKLKNGPGRIALIIAEGRNGGKYSYGDTVEERDVESIYTALCFCKPESIDVFISTLQLMRERWDEAEQW